MVNCPLLEGGEGGVVYICRVCWVLSTTCVDLTKTSKCYCYSPWCVQTRVPPPPPSPMFVPSPLPCSVSKGMRGQWSNYHSLVHVKSANFLARPISTPFSELDSEILHTYSINPRRKIDQLFFFLLFFVRNLVSKVIYFGGEIFRPYRVTGIQNDHE